MSGNNPDYYARGGWIDFFEQMQQLHGFEATLMDLAQDRQGIYRLRDDLLRFNLDWLNRWLAQDTRLERSVAIGMEERPLSQEQGQRL